jgi:uncharacterized protein (DUF39 family)
VKTTYNEFRVLHQGNDHEISRSPGVIVGFSNALIEKYPTFPQAPLRKFIKTHIRIKAVNRKIVEERKEKHRQIQLRIAQREREARNNEEFGEMEVDEEFDFDEEVAEEMDVDEVEDEEEPETIRYNADHAILASFNEYMNEETSA